MSDESQQPIVIKRIKKGGGAAHGGAWKVAYADFVTAMMAFFLLLLAARFHGAGDLEGIAKFFQNPLEGGRAKAGRAPAMPSVSIPGGARI